MMNVSQLHDFSTEILARVYETVRLLANFNAKCHESLLTHEWREVNLEFHVDAYITAFPL